MPYQVLGDDRAALDAHLDLDGADITFHSRGGARGGAGVRNTDYGIGLRLVLERLGSAGIKIEDAWVDSGHVQHLPLQARRMKAIGRTGDRSGGNSTKRVRIRLAGRLENKPLDRILRLQRVQEDFRSEERLPTELLSQVTADQIHRAVQRVIAGEVPAAYGPSTDFDLVTDGGVRLPPNWLGGVRDVGLPRSS